MLKKGVKHHKMENDLYVTGLRPGSGSLKYYDYYVNNIKIVTKKDVYKAIKLGISNVLRKDKITGKMEKFDYKKLNFEVQLTGNVLGIRGDVSGITGNASGIRGDVSEITGDVLGITGNISGIRGDASEITGDVLGIIGNVSGITGNFSGITGDIEEIKQVIQNE